MNTSPTPVTIYQGTTLGQFTPVSELLLVKLQQSLLPATYSASIPADIDLAGSVLSPDQKRELLKLFKLVQGFIRYCYWIPRPYLIG